MHRRSKPGRRLAGLLVAGALLAIGQVTAGGPATGMSVCSGPNPPPSCDPADPPTRENNPTGSLTAVSRQPAGLVVTGTAQDPDTEAAVHVVITVDGTSIGTLTTNAATGAFSGTLPARAGSTVCAKALNQGLGTDTVVGCTTYTVALNPYGSLDAVTPSPAGLRVQGWSIDPDTANPISVKVTLDGALATTATAAGDRPDVATAFPGYGSLHGYDVTVPAAPGVHTVCTYGINTGPGTSDSLLTCLQATEPGPPAAPQLLLDAFMHPPAVSVNVGGYTQAKTYTLERQTRDSFPPYSRGPWSVVRTNGKVGSEWRDYDVVPGSTYCYRAVGINGYGTSPVSQTQCAEILLPPLPPPTDLSVSDVTSTQATLHWTDNDTNETSYLLRVGGLGKIPLPAHRGTGAMSHTVTGLKSGVTVCFSVTDQHAGYEDSTSASFCFTTPPTP